LFFPAAKFPRMNRLPPVNLRALVFALAAQKQFYTIKA